MTSKEEIHAEYVRATAEDQEALGQLRQLQDTHTPVGRQIPGSAAPLSEEVVATLRAARERADIASTRLEMAKRNYLDSLKP